MYIINKRYRILYMYSLYRIYIVYMIYQKHRGERSGGRGERREERGERRERRERRERAERAIAVVFFSQFLDVISAVKAEMRIAFVLVLVFMAALQYTRSFSPTYFDPHKAWVPSGKLCARSLFAARLRPQKRCPLFNKIFRVKSA
jgi:hypothetical protein